VGPFEEHRSTSGVVLIATAMRCVLSHSGVARVTEAHPGYA